jgi:hypothetical protein
MNLIITASNGIPKEDLLNQEKHLGLRYSHHVFLDNYIVCEILDKPLFMLAVIKYGIEFKEL